MLIYEDHKAYDDHNGVVYALAFAPDGSSIASGAKDGAVYLRDAAGGRHALLERGPSSLPVYSIVYAPDGAVVVGGAFGWLGYRQNGEGKWGVFGPTKMAPATGLAVLDEHTLAVGTGERVKPTAGSFELWNLSTGRRREPHFLEPNGVRAVAACPERRTVAWSTGHRKVCVWDVLKPEPVQFPQSKNCPAVALSPDGKLLIAAVDYSAKVYDIAKRLELFELKGHKGAVWAVAISPCGETIATGSWDGTVKLWSAATGRERATFKWPIGRVYSLAFAPDGLRLAAGGDLGSVVVWDME
jgi:WD40 repeat protein